MEPRPGLASLFLLFLKIGATAFGAHMVLINLVQEAVVSKRRWMSQEDVLHGISVATTIPGPVAVNFVVFTGYRLRGAIGAWVATTAVLLPSFLLMILMAYHYTAWRDHALVNNLFYGFIPAIAAIILMVAWTLGKKSIQDWFALLLAFMCAAILLVVGGIFTPVLLIIISTLLGYFVYRSGSAQKSLTKKPVPFSRWTAAGVLVLPLLPFLTSIMPTTTMPLLNIAMSFSGVSVLLFGGGYVAIPLLQEIVVTTHQWLTPGAFVDAIAVGQMTPGPILVSATFIGFQVAGLPGAIIATIAIFLPSGFLMVISSRLLTSILHFPATQASLKGVHAAVTGLIFASVITIAQSTTIDYYSISIFFAALLALFRFKAPPVVVIFLAGLMGCIPEFVH